MNIQQNKINLAAKTINLDMNNMNMKQKIAVPLQMGNNSGLYQTAKKKLLAGVAQQAIVQQKQMLGQINAENERQNQQAATDAAVQKAEGEAMEKAQQMEDERLAQAARAQKKPTRFVLPNVSQEKNNFIRNAMIIGGGASVGIISSATFFPVLFGNG